MRLLERRKSSNVSGMSPSMFAKRSKSSALDWPSLTTSSFSSSVRDEFWLSLSSGSSSGSVSSLSSTSSIGFSFISCSMRSCKARIGNCRISIDWIIRGANFWVCIWRASSPKERRIIQVNPSETMKRDLYTLPLSDAEVQT